MTPSTRSSLARFSAVRAALSLTLLTAGLGLVSGCSILPAAKPDLTKFYVLDQPEPATESAAVGSLKLGLRALDLAPYLKGRLMVVRSHGNELAFQDASRWAEPLDTGIARVIRARLLAAPAVARVQAYPNALDADRVCDVTVSITHCEGVRTAGGAVARFAAVFEIVSAGDTPTLLKRQAYVAPDAAWDGKDFGALAASLSVQIAGLADTIAAALPAK